QRQTPKPSYLDIEVGRYQKEKKCLFSPGTDTASQQEFTSCLKETLRGLAKNADNLQVNDLVKALEGGEDGNILPIMQSIMQNLLSKDVLYPSLKEITSKYPEWLETNKSTLSAEDHQRYQQQAKIMGDICKLFENEEEEAGDKERTFESIMDLMQKVMQLQLMLHMFLFLFPLQPPGFTFDMDSLNLPGVGGAGAAEQCSVM
uniref:Peroxisomal biogenesis factor 19 n=1 Tax=Xiphophorus couchianus TaxID=32473 RepID=A0A3B5MZL0_9TELE